MARRVFFSFHFTNDFWRTQQVRNINALEGQRLATPNAWEEIKRSGDAAVKRWIATNLKGKSCVVVLVGSETADRKWVRHEILEGWDNSKGVLGIRIHKLLDKDSNPSPIGPNPFEKLSISNTKKTLADIVPLKNPAGANSKAVYASIANNIETWIEEAIEIRG